MYFNWETILEKHSFILHEYDQCPQTIAVLMVKDDRSLLGLPLDGYTGGVGGRKDRLLTQRTISQLAISYGRGKVTQIVMKLATSPSEMSGLTHQSWLWLIHHVREDQYLDWNILAGYSLHPVNAVIDYE